MEGHRERIDIPQWTLSNPKDVLRCTDTSQKLESAIFNAVSLGQWEIARAHFVSFARGRVGVGSDAVCRENARELLKLLAMEASNFWSDFIMHARVRVRSYDSRASAALYKSQQ